MFHNEYLKTLEAALKEAAPDSKARHVKRYLADCEAVLKSRHLALTGARPPEGVQPLQAGARGAEVCAAYTLVIDGLLEALFKTQYEQTGCSDPAALVAIGGYGRGELNIRSDIDLMLLYRGRMTPAIEGLNRALLYVLWDTGLDLGFSIRSIDESIALAKDDMKTMTALLDRRFLLGDKALFDEFERAAVKKLFSGSRVNDFIKSKLDENSERRAKFGGSVYTLEPNVKEGEGGLRDMHTAAWVVKAKNTGLPPALDMRGLNPFKGQAVPIPAMAGGLLSEKEQATLRDSLDFILWVRNDLHFSTNRKTDQLTFDHQERISATLGFESAKHALPVELFMQQYYRHASNVDHYCALILSRCLHRDRKKSFFWPSKKIKIDKDFEISDSRLTLRNKETKSIDGLTAIRAFDYAQSFDVEPDQPLKDAILSFAEGCGALQRSGADEWRSSENVAESFIKILKGPNCYRTLAAMHELKFLDAYIPEFAAITCKTQHDLYHVYTVDVHTLFAVREIEMLGGQVEGEFSLLAGICGELTNRAALMLAVLLHDTGKAEGKGHALKGAVMSGHICRRLHMPDDDAALVEFLIRNHLILADTAQYRDLHDEKLIVEFAKKVGDAERLGMLYLLTFADVRAVGPDVWNQWKGALFQELYFKASTVLERGTFEIEDAGAKLKRTQDKTVELLAPSGIMRDYVEEFFQLLPQRYFLANSADTIAGHIKTVRDLSAESKPAERVQPYVMSVRQDKAREYTEFVICTHDVHGLFSMITGVMAANSVNILGAQVNTLKNGICLDVLQVTNPMGGLITDEHKLRRIESDLAGVITGKLKVAALVHKHRKPSILDMKAKPRVPTRVQIDNDASDAYTVVDIKTHNRIGLLYDITSTLSRLGLYIYISKISTKGDEAADIFYVKDIFGQKIFYKEKLRDIADTVYGVLTGIEGAQSSK
ncbi:MAG: [protein-PII] uridylyltransferase [Deltaproteobacteria bacterium]|nr:[protein-PII] uridylyltransferase [Deltaproteobacteria bacterium]